jgi:hypothetical protein
MTLFNTIRTVLGGSDDDVSETLEAEEDDSEQFAVSLTSERVLRGRDGEIEVLAEGEDGEMYAGSWGREMFENARKNSEQPIWLGSVEDQIGDAREVGIPFENLQRHAGIFGTTGSGKSTVERNIMVQLAHGGHGFAYLDPKGSDVYDLLLQLPEDRLEDVIWVQPGSPRQKSISFNLLEAPVPHDDPNFDNEVSGMLDDLQSFISGKHGGGARIEGVIDTIGAAMIRSEKPYTLADMYFILVDGDRRQAFAQEVETDVDEVLAEYAEKVAEMKDDELDALVRRLKKWVETPVTRELVATPESDLDFDTIIEENKILLVDNSSVDSDDIKQMVATAVIRSIWASKKRLGKDKPEHERTPFFLLIDEFDDVVTSSSGEAMQIGKILSKARSFWLSLIMASQFPSQIPESVRDEMFGNTNTLLNLNVRLEKDARILAEPLKEVSGEPVTKHDIMQLPPFKTWFQYTLNGETKEPVKVSNFAPYPPVRARSEIESIITRSLDRYGSERLRVDRLEDICLIDGAPTNEADDETAVEVEAVVNAIDIACQYESHRTGETVEYVEQDLLEMVLDALDVDTGYNDLDHVLELDGGHYIDVREGSGNAISLGLTDDGKKEAKKQNSGGSSSAGKAAHRNLLKDTREELAKHGVAVEVPEQHGPMPDAIGYPFDLDETSPLADLVGDHEMFYIETEATTDSRPAQPLDNLVKALEAGVPCLFVVREAKEGKSFDHKAAKYERFILDDPACASKNTPYGTLFYTRNDTDLIKRNDGDEEVIAVRPKAEDVSNRTMWYQEGDDELVLRDNTGTEYARFEDLEAFENWQPEDYPAYCVHKKGSYVVWHDGRSERYSSLTELKQDWVPVLDIFLPKRDLPAGVHPSADSFGVLIIPTDDYPDLAPQYFEDGEQTPLSDVPESDTTSSTETTTKPATEDVKDEEDDWNFLFK